jgi:hypothetical protein
MKKRAKGKRKNNQKLAILLLLLLGVAILAILSYRGLPQPQKIEAAEYFEILDPAYIGTPANGSQIIITQLAFEIKAVKGDAHWVIIQTRGNAEINDDLGTILKGEKKFVEINFPSDTPYSSRKTEKGYPVIINVASSEAEGLITFYPS